MNTAREILGSIKVELEFSSALAAFADVSKPASQELAAHVVQFCHLWVIELNIPADVFVTVTARDDLGEQYRILINGVPCRVPIPIVLPEKSSPVEFARLLFEQVIPNAELLINEDLAERIRLSYLDDKVASASQLNSASFHQLLKLLVGRKFGIDRIRSASVTGTNGQTPGPEDIFEAALADWNSTQVKVLVRQREPKTLADPAKSLETSLDEIREELFEDLGLVVPLINIEINEALAEHEFQIKLNDVTLPVKAGLTTNQFLVNAPPDSLALLGVDGTLAIHPDNGSSCTISEGQEALDACQNAGLFTWDAVSYIGETLAGELRRNAGDFLTAPPLKFILDLTGERYPQLVEVTLGRYRLNQVAAILRSLLDEEISIRNLQPILECLLCLQGTTVIDHSKFLVFHNNPPDLCPVSEKKNLDQLTTEDYVRVVRITMKNYISYKYSGGSGTLVYYGIESGLERRIAGVDSPLDERDYEQIIQSIKSQVVGRSASTLPVIVTSILARQKLKLRIEKEFPRLAVISYQEISPAVRTQRITQIGLS